MASESGPTTTVRVIIQQCINAVLEVQPATKDEEAQHVNIGRGIIVYLCFLKDATTQIVEKMVKAVLGVRLSESGGKLVSVLNLPGSVLIVPQATLGGKMKGKVMQYHSNINKAEGQELYTFFTRKCTETFTANAKCQESGCEVKFGSYGNRQVLTVETNGPYSHIIEL